MTLPILKFKGYGGGSYVDLPKVADGDVLLLRFVGLKFILHFQEAIVQIWSCSLLLDMYA